MADKIVAEYTVKVDKAIKDLEKLASRVDKVDTERKKTEAGFKEMSKSLGSSFAKLGATIGIAFGAAEAVRLGKEMVTLAAQAEGVERAFKRIGSAELLADLRKATRGTVTDLQLMQNAVKASNFKIPLEQLANLFAFAKARASETGESVDYLVDSITTGIGRKSPLILDNLGISAVALKEKLNGVGLETASIGDIAQAVGAIAKEELAKMGDQADTTADKLAALSATYANFLKNAGQYIIDFAFESAKLYGIISQNQKAVDDLTASLDKMSAVAIGEQVKIQREELEKANQAYIDFRKVMDDIASESPELAAKEEARLGSEIKLQKELYDLTVDTFNARIEAGREGIPEPDFIDPSELDKITASVKHIDDSTVDYIRSINQLNKELKGYQDELKYAEIGSSQFFSIIDRITSKTKELNEAIALTKLADALKVDEELDIDLSKVDAEVNAFLDSFLKKEELVFGEEGTKRIKDYWDAFVSESLAALETTEERTQRLADLEAKRRQENMDFFNVTLQSWQSLTSTISSLVEAQYQRESTALDQKLKNDQITREEYDRRRAQLAREQAKKQKEFAITQAIINTALGVTNAFATAPNIILGAVLAAVVAAAGAAEIATISSQPLPTFAEGGFVDEHGQLIGRKHAQGGIQIEAEGGEFITSAKHAKNNADILRAINSGDWEKYKLENIIAPAINQVLEGGFEGLGASYALQNNFNDKNLLRQGDRNRYAMRDGFVYLADRLERALKSNSGRYASN